MTLLECERTLINKRIAEITQEKENAGMDRKVVISGGIPVLEAHKDEIKALKDMLDILDKYMEQSTQSEYLEAREKTKLPHINDKFRGMLINAGHQKVDERDRVERRIKQLLSDYNIMMIGIGPIPFAEADKMKPEDYREYEALLKMREIVQNDFKTPYYYEYRDLRDQTKLDKLDETEYQVLMGREAPKRKEMTEEKEPEVSQERTPNMSEIAVREPQNTTEMQAPPVPEPTGLQPQGPGEEMIVSPQLQEEEPRIIDLGDVTPEQPKLEAHDEEPIEIESITPWKWIKDHKKQILIALGLTALTITTVVALTQLLPAIVAATKASQVAGIASQMVTNGTMWHTAIASEQAALHGANTALASIVSSLTGASNSFNVATGMWTIGAETLPQFAVSAATTAASAASKVSMLTNLTTMGAIGGYGALGAGLLLPNKKSPEYYAIKDAIEKLKKNGAAMNAQDQIATTQMISNRIISSRTLSEKERQILFRKLQKLLKNIKNLQLEEPVEKIEAEQIGERPPEIDPNNIIDVDFVEVEPELARSM